VQFFELKEAWNIANGIFSGESEEIQQAEIEVDDPMLQIATE
jgi:hypothetical protein